VEPEKQRCDLKLFGVLSLLSAIESPAGWRHSLGNVELGTVFVHVMAFSAFATASRDNISHRHQILLFQLSNDFHSACPIARLCSIPIEASQGPSIGDSGKSRCPSLSSLQAFASPAPTLPRDHLGRAQSCSPTGASSDCRS